LHYYKPSVWSTIKMHVGTSENINHWSDNWLGEPLVGLLQIDSIHHANFSGTVLDVIVDGRWNFPDCLLPRVNYLLVSVVMLVSPLPDTLVWPHSPDGKLSAKQAMLFLKPVAPLLPWADMIWRSCIPPFHSFIFWRLYLGKMPTDENLRARGCVVVFVCSFCLKTDESSIHLFLHFPFAVELWIWICGRLNCTFDLSSVTTLLSCIHVPCSSQVSDTFVDVVVYTLHIIWISRNLLQFYMDVVSQHAAKVRLHTFVAMSGNLSVGHCLQTDVLLIGSLFVSAHHRRIKDIIVVHWKALPLHG